MMILLLILSIVGLVLSVVVHAATFSTAPPLLVENAWLLNPGLALVWLPLLISGSRRLFRYGSADDEWKIVPRHAPDWARTVSIVLLIYAFFNFIVVMVFLNQGGFPAEIDGKFVLHMYNYGDVIRELTPEAYRLHQAYLVHAASGHWIFLYFFAAVSAASAQKESARRRVKAAPSLLE